MTTTSRFPRLCSSLLRTASLVLGLALCASAWASPNDKNVVARKAQAAAAQPVQDQPRIKYYAMSIASAIPQPVERLGAIPTTTSPLLVAGHYQISKK